MARKLLPLLALCALAVPVASGCGAEDAAGVDVAKAAQTTGRQGTARVDLKMKLSGMGLPGAMDVRARGVSALTEARMDLTIDVGKALASMGAPVGDADVRLKVDRGQVYLKPPALPGVELPGGATWAQVDAAEAVRAFGLDPAGMGALFKVDPAAQLKALTEAADLKEVGEEDIAGAKTTHLRGNYTIEDAINSLRADQREAARRAYRELGAKESSLDDPMPVDLWVDDEGIVRRMSSRSDVPAQQGVPAGRVDLTMELSDFGAELDVSPPAEDDTYDATKALVSFFKSGASGLLGP